MKNHPKDIAQLKHPLRGITPTITFIEYKTCPADMKRILQLLSRHVPVNKVEFNVYYLFIYIVVTATP